MGPLRGHGGGRVQELTGEGIMKALSTEQGYRACKEPRPVGSLGDRHEEGTGFLDLGGSSARARGCLLLAKPN